MTYLTGEVRCASLVEQTCIWVDRRAKAISRVQPGHRSWRTLQSGASSAGG